MKFCHTLDEQRRLSPLEWGPFFLNYKLLKKKIKMMTNANVGHESPTSPSTGGAGDLSNGDTGATCNANSHRATTPQALASSQSEVEFFRLMDYEIRRGAQFLALSEGQYVLKIRSVLDGYRSTQHFLQSPMVGLEGIILSETAKDMWIRLLHACISVYTELLLLNHWVIVSYCGFSKILKKHDRWTGYTTKEKYLRCVVAKQHFTSYPKLHAMLSDMDVLYLHISGRLPQCPERVEGETKMNEIKRVVAAVAVEFSAHTDELTRSIQDQHRREDQEDAPAPDSFTPRTWTWKGLKGRRDDDDGGITPTTAAAVHDNCNDNNTGSSNSGSGGSGGSGSGSGDSRGRLSQEHGIGEPLTTPAAAAGAAASLFCSVRGGVGAGAPRPPGAAAGKRRRAASSPAGTAGGLPVRRPSSSSPSCTLLVGSDHAGVSIAGNKSSSGDPLQLNVYSAAGGAATTTAGVGARMVAGGAGVGVRVSAAGLVAAKGGGLAGVGRRVTVRMRALCPLPGGGVGGGGGGGDLAAVAAAVAANADAAAAAASAAGTAVAEDVVAEWSIGGADLGR